VSSFRTFFCYIILVICWRSTNLAAQHKVWKQYTTNDGLASNEVYDIIQDQKGYIWFVTNKGICKFDGYSFSQPIDSSTIAGTEAFFPFEDVAGRIWFTRLDEAVWYVENDTIKYWKYNSLLDSLKVDFDLIRNIFVDDKNNVWLSLRGIGALTVQPNGSNELYRASDSINILFTMLDHHPFTAIQNGSKYVKRDTHLIDPSLALLFLQDGQLHIIDHYSRNKIINSFPTICQLKENEFLLNAGTAFWHVKDFKLQDRIATNLTCRKIVYTKEQEILISSNSGDRPGLFSFHSIQDLKADRGQNLFPNVQVCDLLIDHSGGWWVATRGNGIYYCSNPKLDVFDEQSGLPNRNVLRLAVDSPDIIYAGMWYNDLVKINLHSGTVNSLNENYNTVEGEISALYYDSLSHTLFRSFPLSYVEKNEWHQILIQNEYTKSMNYVPAKEIIRSPKGTSLWMAAVHGFYQMNSTSYQINHFQIPDFNTSERTFCIAEDYAGRIWVSTIHGLRVYQDSQYVLPPFQHPALQFRATDLDFLADSSLIISFLGGGIVIRHPDQTIEQLTTKEGLSSDYINRLYVSSENILYACTNTGLNQIQLRHGTWQIRQISKGQGLPSSIINDVLSLHGELWIATSLGLVHLKELPVALPSEKPKITAKIKGRQELFLKPDSNLSNRQNALTIYFHAFDFRSQGEILYRYRFPQRDSSYTYTKSREVNFPDLSPGTYHFEVQAQNADGIWSEASIFNFTIDPPWWRTWWFLTLTGICIAFFGSRVMNIRLKAIKDKAISQNKIKDLELAALRAQMNPHFIFNCLGSIQQFIAENEKDSATRYLAKFARLVRLSLHSSVDGQHSLSEEAEMLENYLSLEQMRFKDKFTFEIDLNAIDQPDELYMPPLLIQPFVENAIIHGMKNKAEQGKIKIAFAATDQILQAIVTDNGQGLPVESEQADSNHKSVGMSLTNKRLQLLADDTNKHSYIIETMHSLDGQPAGTRVIVQISLIAG